MKPGMAILLFPSLLACGGESRGSQVVVRDSAGVSIAESAAPAWDSGEGWAVDSIPVLDLAKSGSGPPHEFFDVRDATISEQGIIAVADRGSAEIRLFSGDGAFLSASGGVGEGPGEFGPLGAIYVDQYEGDSLFVFDSQLRRVTILPPQGAPRIISSVLFPLRDLVPIEGGGYLARIMSMAIETYDGRDGPIFRGEEPIVRFSAAGDLVDTIALCAGSEEHVEAGLALFEKDSHYAVHGGRIHVGNAVRMEFEVYSYSGDLERIVRVPGMAFEITSEDIEDEQLARLGPDPTPERLKSFRHLPIPEAKPAYSDLLVDSNGYTWLGEYRHIWADRTIERSNRKPRVWTIFDPAGRWMGQVQLPAMFVVFEIGPDFVLGLQRDEMDIEHVQLLRLNRN